MMMTVIITFRFFYVTCFEKTIKEYGRKEGRKTGYWIEFPQSKGKMKKGHAIQTNKQARGMELEYTVRIKLWVGNCEL